MKFAKSFESFQEGLNALKKVSFSATSALTNQELKPREDLRRTRRRNRSDGSGHACKKCRLGQPKRQPGLPPV